ncbi:MAG: hypothetical protein IJ689_03500 [Alphaproteobacteria bacterium]|nr:hypothetical protein [Alphaproteobacteria bacterium]
MQKFWAMLLMLAVMPISVAAQGLTANANTILGEKEVLPQRTSEAPKDKPLTQYVDAFGNLAMKNIFEAEQVFCYEVFPYDPAYEGYALNGYPIRGFCGVRNHAVRDLIAKHFFSTEDSVDFQNTEECMIQPKVMLRFVRGVDYTDVLFSSPCYALVVYYAGMHGAFNYRPAAELIDTILKNLQSQHQEFVSPALLNQLMPIGIIQNEQQRKMIKKNNEPIRKWETKAKQNVQKQEEEHKKQNSGWNKLKTRMK